MRISAIVGGHVVARLKISLGLLQRGQHLVAAVGADEERHVFLVGVELLLLRQPRDQRGNAAAEQPIDQAPRLCCRDVVPLYGGGLKLYAALRLRRDCTLGNEPGKQGLHGRQRPVAVAGTRSAISVARSGESSQRSCSNCISASLSFDLFRAI